MTQHSASISATGLKPGDKLDKFDVLEQIGAGGMSIVWKGYDGLLDQYVAIKQLMPESGDDEEFRERFRREAALQKRLAAGHKHLVRVIDVIEEPRGLFIVMEYVEGQSLEQLLEQTDGPIDQRQALGIIAATAVAMEHVHGEHVVHRDLKPSNILLPKDGGLKVCDFGLAEVMTDQATPSSGSVRYIAPELFRGDAVDGRADIYALGMIAYEMLAGRPSFKDAFKVVLRDTRNQALRWMKWHTNDRVNAPPLTERNPDVADTLSELVARMMEKDADKRIASATELLAAIKRHFAGKKPQHPTSAALTRTTGTPVGSTRGPIAPAEKTAALPTAKKSPAVKIVLISTIALVVLAGGMFAYLIVSDIMAQRRAAAAALAEAEELYQSAKAAYDDQRWAAAKEQLDELADQWPDHPKYGQAGKAVSLFAAGMLHFQAGRYQDSIDALQASDEYDVVDRGKIEALIDQNRHRQSFDLEIASIEKTLRDGDYRQARTMLHRLRRIGDHFSDEEQRMEDLGARIEHQDRQREILAILDQAKREEQQGSKTRAIAVLREAAKSYSDSRITDMLGRLQDDVSYAAMLDAARQAEASGDLQQAIVKWEAVTARRPDPAIDQKVNGFRSRLAYTNARQLEDAGNINAAVAEYNKSLSFAENTQARAALARLDNLDEQQSYIRSGDQAAAAGNYQTAIDHYKKALDLGAGGEVQAKLSQATVQVKLADALRLLQSGEFDACLAAVAEVEQLDPGNARAARIRGNVQVWQKYLGLRNEADELRAQGELGRALLKYRETAKIIDTDSVPLRAESGIFWARATLEGESGKSVEVVVVRWEVGGASS